MAQSTEFEGDEFSNNLFSDLAPLLTLFGEQVTKQFLSMNMGWADNVLLAVGPLGIITTVVSAIRVGGGRTMKALVGRARENQSTAEQELLSSTSSNVCELWSGQQIVRLIGETEGARTLLVAGDGEVFDLESAENEGLIKLSPPPKAGGISTESLHNPTPNLALNAGKAIASQTELWFWAAIGVLLQLFATAFPGIVTYSWSWSKAGSQVARYGYPCLLIGTILLTLGMALCGHIIEGVTTEQEISLTTEGKVRYLRFFSLQGSRTVGDQKFPSCVLFLAEDDNVLKISRLNSKNYRKLAVTATAFAITGYIVQFVGFRALHWSATIVQLGTTLAMTGVRAWVRRSLTSDPQTASPLQGQEVPWLALNILWPSFEPWRYKNHFYPPTLFSRRPLSNSRLCNILPGLIFNPLKTLLDLSRKDKSKLAEYPGYDTRLLWSLIFCRNTYYTDETSYEYHHYPNENLYCHLRSRHHPWKTSLRQKNVFDASTSATCSGVGLTAKLIQAHKSINYSISHEASSHQAAELATVLCAVIANVMEALSFDSMVTWKSTSDWKWFKDDAPEDPSEICWELSVGFLSNLYRNTHLRDQDSLLHLHLSASRNNDGSLAWEPPNGESIQAALSLSLYSESMISTLGTSRSQTTSMVGIEDSDPNAFRRIIGHATPREVEAKTTEMSKWITQPIFSCVLFPQRSGEEILQETAETLASYLGMFLSFSVTPPFQFSFPGYGGGVGPLRGVRPEEIHEQVLYVLPQDDSTKALQYAQEFFSIFMLAVASVVESVNGETVRKAREDGSGMERLENSVFRMIASEIVDQGLAKDVEEAYTLIIPAFAKYNLLPTESSERDSATSENQEAQVIITASPSFDIDSASEELELLQNPTPQHSSAPLQQPQDSIPHQSSTEQQDPTTTHQDPSLEQGSLVHPQPSQQSHVSELSAAQPSEETSSSLTEQ